MPFGSGPWQCQNAACAYSQRLIITEQAIVKNTGSEIIGQFTCPQCKYTYEWHALDETTGKQLRFSLEDNINIDSYSMSGRKRPKTTYQKRPKTREGLSKTTRAKPFKIEGPGYKWVNKNGQPYLMSNLSPLQKSGRYRSAPFSEELLWQNRDADLAPKVYAVAKRLREQEGKPVRITKAAIQRKIDLLRRSNSLLDRLPKTKRALEEEVETLENIALRRITWAEAEFRRENLCPSRSKFITKASLAHLKTRFPKLQDAVDAVLERLSRLHRIF